MVVRPRLRRPDKSTPRVPRYILSHASGTVPADDLAFIQGLQGVKIVNRHESALLVEASADLQQQLEGRKGWRIRAEVFYRLSET